MLNTELNIDRVLQDLNALSSDLKEKAIKAGVAKVSASGLQLMQANVPVETGGVRQSLGRKQLSPSQRARLSIQPGVIAVVVGPNRRVSGWSGRKIFRGRIANILESGARAHEILPGKSSLRLNLLYAQGLRRKADVLYSAKTKTFFGKKVSHPGLSARRFIQATDQQNSSRVQGLFYQGIESYLARRRS